MVLFLTRQYFSDGTNGQLQSAGKNICKTIELPWKNNQRGVSCIPEGEYFLQKRYSSRYGWHIEVAAVPGREYILFHPANNAKTELRGCIAPVTKHSGAGLGLMSRKAFNALKSMVYKVLEQNRTVQLIVQS